MLKVSVFYSPFHKHLGTLVNVDDVICYARPVLHSVSVRKKIWQINSLISGKGDGALDLKCFCRDECSWIEQTLQLFQQKKNDENIVVN